MKASTLSWRISRTCNLQMSSDVFCLSSAVQALVVVGFRLECFEAKSKWRLRLLEYDYSRHQELPCSPIESCKESMAAGLRLIFGHTRAGDRDRRVPLMA